MPDTARTETSAKRRERLDRLALMDTARRHLRDNVRDARANGADLEALLVDVFCAWDGLSLSGHAQRATAAVAAAVHKLNLP